MHNFNPLQAALNAQGYWNAGGPLSPLLPRADDPCLVIDAAGRIVAANERAAQLLGRPSEALQGEFFGIWGPELDHADLDLIRVRNGLAEASSVRARRFSEAGGDEGHTSIVFEPLPPLRVPLAMAVAMTALEVPAVNLSLSFSSLPATIQVGREFQEMVRAWVVFFRNTADSGLANLRIRTSGSDAGRLALEFCLHQPDPPPLRSGSYESDDLDHASVAVEKLGGSFQLRVDYPDIVATIQVPHENRPAA
jgi:hypothetical protein